MLLLYQYMYRPHVGSVPRVAVIRRNRDVLECNELKHDCIKYFKNFCLIGQKKKEIPNFGYFLLSLVLRAGLEPARIAPHAPQTCAATNYATSAIERSNYSPANSPHCLPASRSNPADSMPEPIRRSGRSVRSELSLSSNRQRPVRDRSSYQ